MTDHVDIDHLQELLGTHRRTLLHLLKQVAAHGGMAFAPPHVWNSIYETREQIRKIKETLRAKGLAVPDQLGDEPLQATRLDGNRLAQNDSNHNRWLEN